MRRLQKPSGKKKKARTKRQKLRRTLAILLLVGGVLLETVANIVQLVESDTIADAVATVETPLEKAERWVRQALP